MGDPHKTRPHREALTLVQSSVQTAIGFGWSEATFGVAYTAIEQAIYRAVALNLAAAIRDRIVE